MTLLIFLTCDWLTRLVHNPIAYKFEVEGVVIPKLAPRENPI